SYSKPTAVIFTLGLVFLASNSAPFDSATKNGLPIEPSETPIDFSSFAKVGAELKASAIAAPASEIVFNIGFLPGLSSYRPPHPRTPATSAPRAGAPAPPQRTRGNRRTANTQGIIRP